MTDDHVIPLRTERGDQIASLVPLFRNIVVDGDCWVWQHGVNGSGYPHLKADGKIQYAHRLMVAGWDGIDLDGLVVHHRCGQKRCIAPHHLVVMDNGSHVALHHELRRAVRQTGGRTPTAERSSPPASTPPPGRRRARPGATPTPPTTTPPRRRPNRKDIHASTH